MLDRSAGRDAVFDGHLFVEAAHELKRLSSNDGGLLCFCGEVDPFEADAMGPGGFADAAIVYALVPDDLQELQVIRGTDVFPPVLQFWPVEWELTEFSPLPRRASLLRAAALLLLEVTRLDCLAGTSGAAVSGPACGEFVQ